MQEPCALDPSMQDASMRAYRRDTVELHSRMEGDQASRARRAERDDGTHERSA